MADTTYEHQLEGAFIDILDGNSKWWDIVAHTGLSEERAKEIEALFAKALVRYKKRNRC